MKTENENWLTAELIDILRAVAIVSPQSFVFAGRVIQASSPDGAGMGMGYPPNTYANMAGGQGQRQPQQGQQGQSGQQNALLIQLQNHLYQYCYSVGLRAGFSEDVRAVDVTAQAAFVQSLSAANASVDRWDEGWRVNSLLPTGQVLAEKGVILKAVWPGEFLVPGGTGMAPMVGVPLNIFMPRESTVMQSGFYFAFGQTPSDW